MEVHLDTAIATTTAAVAVMEAAEMTTATVIAALVTMTVPTAVSVTTTALVESTATPLVTTVMAAAKSVVEEAVATTIAHLPQQLVRVDMATLLLLARIRTVEVGRTRTVVTTTVTPARYIADPTRAETVLRC